MKEEFMIRNISKKLLGLVMVCVLCLSLCTQKVQANAPTDFWVATFQLTWNDLMDKIVKGPVEFIVGNPKLADELNKQGFKADMLSPDSYYKICAKKNKKLKKQIEKDIYRKFHEKSDILDKFEWNDKPNQGYFIYAMLKKDFQFLTPFNVLPSTKFADSKKSFKYFGLDSKSTAEQKKNVKPLFYNSENDYAVLLTSKKNDEVILYRNDSDKSFNDLYKEVENKTKKIKLKDEDRLKVPFINIDKEVSYDELTGKEIKNTDRLYIGKALQTIKFSMDNKGGKIKSEAAMDIMKMSMPIERPYHYNFDKPFVLFLKETNSSKPYFALWVKNTDYLVKD